MSKRANMTQAAESQKVDCWMEVAKGEFGATKPIDGPVKVGEKLTLSIYIKDEKGNTDVRVKVRSKRSISPIVIDIICIIGVPISMLITCTQCYNHIHRIVTRLMMERMLRNQRMPPFN